MHRCHRLHCLHSAAISAICAFTQSFPPSSKLLHLICRVFIRAHGSFRSGIVGSWASWFEYIERACFYLHLENQLLLVLHRGVLQSSFNRDEGSSIGALRGRRQPSPTLEAMNFQCRPGEEESVYVPWSSSL